MSADGTVNIDVKLDAQQPTQTAKDLDDLLKDIGKGTGKEAKKSINENLNKSVDKTKEARKKMDSELDKPIKQKVDADTSEATEKIRLFKHEFEIIPHEVRTKLIADAKKNGIDNFGKLLRKIPKEQRTELIAKAQKGEAINYEELLRKIPARVITEAKLNDHASLPLRQLQTEAKETSHSFSRLKDVMAGTFLGGMATQGLNGIKNGLIASAKAGMQFNIEQDRMRTVWSALTTEAPVSYTHLTLPTKA